jgi:hypothetical protein
MLIRTDTVRGVLIIELTPDKAASMAAQMLAQPIDPSSMRLWEAVARRAATMADDGR